MTSFNTGRSSDFMETPEESSVLRCRKCRRCVVDSRSLLWASKDFMTTCSVWHMNTDALPDWILSVVNQVHWTVGKLNCRFCGARLGGFNFINCPKCPCGHNTTVHLSKSRVDQGVRLSVHFSHPGSVRGRTERLESQTKVLDQQKAPEGQEVRYRLRSVPDMNSEPQLVVDTLNSETEFSSMQIQEILLEEVPLRESNQEPQRYMSVDGDNETPGAHESHMPIEPSGYLENTEDGRSHLTVQDTPSLETSTEQETEETRPEVTEHPLHPVQMTKRQRNRLKSLRRKQKKRERWLQSQHQQEEQSVKWNLTSSCDAENYTCAVCLDVFFKPHMCRPCNHVFCEPCLRALARNRVSRTPCPICRTLISDVLFQSELDQTTKTYFPVEYQSQMKMYQKTNYSRWPLPRGFQRYDQWLFTRRQGDHLENVLSMSLLLLLACIIISAFFYNNFWMS